MGVVLAFIGNVGDSTVRPIFCRKISAACREVPELRVVMGDTCCGADVSFSRYEKVRPGPVLVRITLPGGVELPPDRSHRLAERIAESIRRFYPEHGYARREVMVDVFLTPQLLAFESPEDLLEQLNLGSGGVARGVMLRVGETQRVFLPSAWEKYPEPRVFMNTLASDAGLNPEAWRQPDAKILTYNRVATFITKNTC